MPTTAQRAARSASHPLSRLHPARRHVSGSAPHGPGAVHPALGLTVVGRRFSVGRPDSLLLVAHRGAVAPRPSMAGRNSSEASSGQCRTHQNPQPRDLPHLICDTSSVRKSPEIGDLSESSVSPGTADRPCPHGAGSRGDLLRAHPGGARLDPGDRHAGVASHNCSTAAPAADGPPARRQTSCPRAGGVLLPSSTAVEVLDGQ